MAKTAAKPKKEITMEEALWKSADKLRGSVEFESAIIGVYKAVNGTDEQLAQISDEIKATAR